jgi:NAD(P)H-dependent FMN reductase
MKILGISGSLRDESFNTKLLRAAVELAPDEIELEIWDGLKAVPPFDEDDEIGPAPAGGADATNAPAPTPSSSRRRSTTRRFLDS